MYTHTARVPHLPYRPSKLPRFDDPTKRIDLFQLEAHLHRSRRTDVMAVVPPPDDFDTRKTTPHRALFPPPPMRPVFRTRRDPLPLVLVLVLLSTCCAVASLIAFG